MTHTDLRTDGPGGAAFTSLGAFTPSTDPDPRHLDSPVRSALIGRHAHLALTAGRVIRYRPDVSAFIGHPPDMTGDDWADLWRLVGAGATFSLRDYDGGPPPDPIRLVRTFDVVQLTGHDLATRPDPEAVVLGRRDVPEMLELVSRTRPGPFRIATVEMGRYLGIRRSGRLVAMAGERMKPTGWTEISAVCVDPDHRRNGLATRLVRAVGDAVRADGATPFLHAAATNHDAIRLYQDLGFTLRHTVVLSFFESGSHSPPSSRRTRTRHQL
ncbi:GNAT family N-acetyltransferase [Gordonia soli]|uniref:GNAT family N-acetyltransferase n=1 Tax=Gordonia soli TaxID=320799 RepID=UPI0012FC4F1E|nr:GNAT family N-acetyltransferase [Gordonia soli]